MNFVDKQNVPFAQVGQDRRQVACFLDRRARSHLEVGAHLVGKNVGEGRLAQPWRAVQQNMVERIPALAGSFHQNLDLVAQPLLPDHLAQRTRAQGWIDLSFARL